MSASYNEAALDAHQAQVDALASLEDELEREEKVSHAELVSSMVLALRQPSVHKNVVMTRLSQWFGTPTRKLQFEATDKAAMEALVMSPEAEAKLLEVLEKSADPLVHELVKLIGKSWGDMHAEGLAFFNFDQKRLRRYS